jgi:hypothetical protein
MAKKRKQQESAGSDEAQHSTYYTYVYMHSCARECLRRAEESEVGQTYMCLSANVFCAMTIEAYLNHIGDELVAGWTHFERKLGPAEKLAFLSEVLDFKFDTGRRPFQLFSEIFSTRNDVAHGKTETVFGDHGTGFDWPKPDWLNKAELTVAKRWYEATTDMVVELSEKLGKGRRPFGISSEGATAPRRKPEVAR